MRVIAELSNAHNGDLALAHRLVDACADAGATHFKTQAYTPAELVALRGDGPAPDPWGAQGWTMRSLYEQAQTPLRWLPELAQHAKDRGMIWFSSVFGIGSLAFLEAIDCPIYKLAAIDFGRRGLRAEVESTGKPVIRSVPSTHRPQGNAEVFYCPPGYPQNDLHGLRQIVGRFDGFSYHGTDAFVPALAIAYGVDTVECHVQLDDVPSKLEANVCLTVSQLADLVRWKTIARSCRG